MPITEYKQYTLVLDLTDDEDKVIIEWLEANRTAKRKGSYSSLIKKGLKLLMEKI